MWWDRRDRARRRGRQGEDADVAAEVAAALAAAEAEARDSGLEDEEGEGRWKPAAGAATSTLASADRTRVGKVVGFFGRSVCPRVCVYLSRTVSEYRFFARCQSPRRANQYIQPYLTLPYLFKLMPYFPIPTSRHNL